MKNNKLFRILGIFIFVCLIICLNLFFVARIFAAQVPGESTTTAGTTTKAPYTPFVKSGTTATGNKPVTTTKPTAKPLSQDAITAANNAVVAGDYAAFHKAVKGDAQGEAMTQDQFMKLSAKVRAQKDLNTAMNTGDYDLFHKSVAGNAKAEAITKDQFATVVAGLKIMQDAGLIPPPSK